VEKTGLLEVMTALRYTAELDQTVQPRTGPEVINSTNPPKKAYFYEFHTITLLFVLLLAKFLSYDP
jgi:hypothetical protein